MPLDASTMGPSSRVQGPATHSSIESAVRMLWAEERARVVEGFRTKMILRRGSGASEVILSRHRVQKL
jgi:hypothetical protein